MKRIHLGPFYAQNRTFGSFSAAIHRILISRMGVVGRLMGPHFRVPDGFDSIDEQEEEELIAQACCDSEAFLTLFRAFGVSDVVVFVRYARAYCRKERRCGDIQRDTSLGK
jgi:hypothetical protein